MGAGVAGAIPIEEDPSAQDRRMWMVCGYVAAALTGILLMFTLLILRRIRARALGSALPC